MLVSLFFTFSALLSQVGGAHLAKYAHGPEICAQLTGNLAANFNQLLKIGLPTSSGEVDTCLCSSAASGFAQTNRIAGLAMSVSGESATISALNLILENAPGHQTCTYPSHCQAACSAHDPCGFTCIDGFIRAGKTCICPANKYVCSGKCQFTSCSSPSQRRPPEQKRRLDLCILQGLEMCGVYSGGKSRRGWECLDTQSNLESCGGCTTPVLGGRATGIDCSVIPHVASVTCSKGACIVEACEPGFQVINSSACITFP